MLLQACNIDPQQHLSTLFPRHRFEHRDPPEIDLGQKSCVLVYRQLLRIRIHAACGCGHSESDENGQPVRCSWKDVNGWCAHSKKRNTALGDAIETLRLILPLLDRGKALVQLENLYSTALQAMITNASNIDTSAHYAHRGVQGDRIGRMQIGAMGLTPDCSHRDVTSWAIGRQGEVCPPITAYHSAAQEEMRVLLGEALAQEIEQEVHRNPVPVYELVNFT